LPHGTPERQAQSAPRVGTTAEDVTPADHIIALAIGLAFCIEAFSVALQRKEGVRAPNGVQQASLLDSGSTHRVKRKANAKHPSDQPVGNGMTGEIEEDPSTTMATTAAVVECADGAAARARYAATSPASCTEFPAMIERRPKILRLETSLIHSHVQSTAGAAIIGSESLFRHVLFLLPQLGVVPAVKSGTRTCRRVTQALRRN